MTGQVTIADRLMYSVLCVRKSIRDLKHRVIGIPWFDVEARDRFLASWPRSGNTWVRSLLAHVLHGAELPDLEALDRLIPTIDYPNFRCQLAALSADRIRIIKTHDRPFRGAERARSVYLVRHPVDAMVSWYHMRSSLRQSSLPIDRFVREVVEDRVRYGSWHRHVASWLDGPCSDRLLLLRYEDLLADTPGSLAAVCRHFGIEADPGRIRQAASGVSIEGISRRFAEWSERRYNRFEGSVAAASAKPKLSTDSIRLVESHAASLMGRLGYSSRLG